MRPPQEDIAAHKSHNGHLINKKGVKPLVRIMAVCGYEDLGFISSCTYDEVGRETVA